jgi:hypothetical protein
VPHRGADTPTLKPGGRILCTLPWHLSQPTAPETVIPSRVARLFLPRSLLRTSPPRSREISLRFIAQPLRFSAPDLGNHTDGSLGAPPFHPILPQPSLQTTPAQASCRFPNLQNRHRPRRQFRAPAAPLGVATHGCIATGASRFHTTILSYLTAFEPCCLY